MTRLRALCAGLLFVACLHTPGLRTTLTVPILARTFRLVDLLAGDWLRVDPDSLLELHFVAGSESIRVNDLIDTLRAVDTLTLSGSDLLITPVAGDSWSVSAEELFGSTVGETVPVPEFGYDSTFVGAVPGIEGAVLAGGVLRVTIENRLPVPLDTVDLAIAGLGTVFLGPVDSFASRQMNLSGLVIDSAVSCTLRLWSRGSLGQPVPIEQGDSLIIGLVIDSVHVKHGTIRLADSSVITGSTTSTSYLSTRHRVRVDSALFAAGQLEFAFTNQLPIGFNAAVSLPEFGYMGERFLDPGAAVGYPLELAGIAYHSSSPDSSRLTMTCTATRLAPAGVLEFDSTRGLVVEYSGGAVGFDYLAGEALDTVWSSAQTETLALAFPDWARHIRARHLLLAGSTTNAIGFDGQVELEATALNAAGESARAVLRVAAPGGTPARPESASFLVDLAGLANIGPNRLVLSGRAGIIGPGRMVNASYVAAQPEVTFPLQAKLLADTFELGPWAVPIDSTIRKQLRLLDGALVSAHIVNHLPISVAGELKLWREWSADTVRLPLGVPLPIIDPASGIVIQARDSVVTMELDSIEARVFDTPSLRAAVSLFLPETDTVSLTARDFFQVEESHGELHLDIKPR